jgi:hypothetical protein
MIDNKIKPIHTGAFGDSWTIVSRRRLKSNIIANPRHVSMHWFNGHVAAVGPKNR